MARLLGDADLFLPVKIQSKANTDSQPRNPQITPATPTMALGNSQESASHVPPRPLRHKRRFTIGGSSQTPHPASTEQERKQAAKKPPEPRSEHVMPKSTVTISRSRSRLHSVQSQSPGSGLGDGSQRIDPLLNEQERPKVQRSVTAPARQDAAVDYCVSRGSSIRSRSPDKAQYPPSSWKSPQKTEATTSTIPGPESAHQIPHNAANVWQRPKLGQARHTEPVLASPIQEQRFMGTASRLSAEPPRRSASARPRLDERVPLPDRTANTTARVQPMYIRSRRRNSLLSSATPTRLARPVIDGHRENRHESPKTVELPELEIAYAHTYHYTTCEHTCPPMSRPLNVQPILVPYSNDLLAYPPFHLQSLLDSPTDCVPSIYIIDGSCCNCDLSERRTAESEVLNKYTTRLENLFLQLNLLQDDIDSKASRTPDPAQDITMSPETVQTIVLMEHQLDDMIHRRDDEVKSIWKGYTERWGPATLGIRHEHGSSRGRSRMHSVSERNMMGPDTLTNSSVSDIDTVAGRTSTIASTVSSRTTPTLFSATGRPKLSTPRRSSTVSARSPQERYSDGTHSVTVASSVDGVRGEGRMVVDWIRPDRGARARSRSQSQSLGRNQR